MAGGRRGGREHGIAVVGAGIVGLATADALVQRGCPVRVYERAAAGSGQSAGRTRIFRHGHDDRRLVALAARARAGWRRWEERFGRELVGRGGALLAGDAAGTRLDALVAEGVPAELAGRERQRELLPLLRPVDGPVLHDVDGGPIRAAAAIQALAGAVDGRTERSEVIAVRPTGRGDVELATSEGLRRHRAAVLCAGADTPRLAATAGIDVAASVAVHLRATFAVRAEAPAGPVACWQDQAEGSLEHVYGSPCPGGHRYAIGLAGHDAEVPADGAGTVTDPARLAEHADRLSAYVEAAMPGLHPEPVATRVCWVTELPGGADAFAAWRSGPLVAFAGGNLFKHAPSLGELLADAATDGTLAPLLQPYGADAG